MKTTGLLAGTLRSVLFVSTLILAESHSVQGAGVVTNCTEGDLRAAMTGGGTVTFACDGTITLASQLTIASDTTLDATGHFIRLSGGGSTRILQVQSGVKLTLKRLTISDGYASTGFGGGLLNSGDATVSDCTFSNNTVVNGPQFGGAINHQGTKLVITGTTFIGNNAEGSGGALSCGNPYLGFPATGNIAITNCTFYGNGGTAATFGPAISLPVTFVNCTFATNNGVAIVTSSGGGIPPPLARVRVMNSILAFSVSPGDNVQRIEDWGFNLSTDNSASLTNATTLKNTNPLLSPLADNGGPTRTMSLLYGSPAIDGANDAARPGTDQRGVARPTRAHSDIGAFEGSVSPSQSTTVHFTSTNFTVGESQGTALVQVERTGASTGSVGVSVSATAGTATAGTDFAPTNVALIFAEGEMQKSVPLTIFYDPARESNETVILNLSNPIGTVPDSPSASQLTILDDVPYVLTNYTDAGLRAAVGQGGWIQFPSNGTITLTSPITVSQFTVLDASGHNVVLSGGNAVRLFSINPGAQLTLMNLTIANGRNQGPNGAAGAAGGQGSGGAINVDNGTLNLLGCRIWTNTAAGGAGGNGNPEGNGGPALGGAIYMFHGTLNATNSEFVGNLASGGPGGTNSPPLLGASRSGGQARGGAIASSGGLIQLDNCSFTLNAVIGGRAPSGGGGGDGNSGEASGGAWFNDGGTAIVTTCSFVFNNGSTPTFSNFPGGRIGGTVRGGSICTVSGAASIFGTEFLGNSVKGGSAQRIAAPAGPGQGGAIFNLDLLELRGCFFQANSANGGDSGIPGGDGLGGAVFNGGQLRIAQSEFEANTVQAGLRYGPSVSGIARGGAIFTTNSLWLNDSTLHGNTASGAAGSYSPGPFPGYPAYGGAIYSSGTSYLTNNTLTANVARGGPWTGPSYPPSLITAGGDAYGGGFYQTNGTAFLLNNTLAGNSAQGGTGNPNGGSYGGGIANTNGAVTLLNTIVANSPSGSNCFGTLTDAGHNLSSDTSCNFTNTGSLNNNDPKLGPLDDYGGPTPTMPLLTGSPAIDGGDSSSFPPTDQRRNARPYGSAPDIGAFEVVSSTLQITVQPLSRTNVISSSVIFSVTATGTLPLGFQWRKEGTNLPGATDRTYTIAGIQTDDRGAYSAVVTNVYGVAVTSSVAVLTVRPLVPPTILAGPITNPGNGRRYYLLNPSTWVEAEAAAVALGGHLATIRSVAEQAWIYDNFSRWGAIERHLWIGLYDADPRHNATIPEARKPEFIWTSGEPVGYSLWSDGEPNNWQELGEFWVHLFSPLAGSVSGYWNDASDTDFNIFSPINGVVETIPPPVISNASFGVKTNHFGFNIIWTSGQVIVVEASTNLTNPIWVPLQTNTLGSDSFYFSDPQWTNYPGRFYRLRSP